MRNWLKASFGFCSLLLVSISLFSQSDVVYLNRDFEYKYQSLLSVQNVKAHDAVRAYLYSDIKEVVGDSALRYSDGWPMRIWNTPSEKGKWNVGFYPLAEATMGLDAGSNSNVYSRLGIGAGGHLQYKDKLSVRLNFSGHREQDPGYLQSELLRTGRTVDGQVWSVNNNGLHYTNFNGYLSWNVGKYFNFQLGHGKHFIGNGYRSLMLSDNAGNSTYGKITASVWRIKYVVIYGHQKDINNTMSRRYSDWRNKFSTTHYLSWNITKWWNIGLFESVIWKAKDTLLNRGFDVNYLNPVIFLRPVEFSTGSSDNVLLGLNMNFKPVNGYQIYTQVMLDEFLLEEVMKDVKEFFKPGSQSEYGWWANKYGIQLGFKSYNFAGVEGLGLQTEWNMVRPFTYSHSDPVQNYGHQNASMAHPLGANFNEVIGLVNYQKNNWYFQFKAGFYNQGLSTDSANFGEDIYRPYTDRENEYGHVTGQGRQLNVIHVGGRASYLIYHENNLRIFGEATFRNQSLDGVKSRDLLFEIGITTTLFNRYSDI